MTKTWFITGANRGFGREFARAALARGDRVAATSRNLDGLTDLAEDFGDALLPLELDVTDRNGVNAAVGAAVDHFGRVDVVVNNAGYGLFGMVEEITEQQLRDQLEVNLFGVLYVTQAFLPVLRGQGGGHIIQISTIGGITTFPNLGGYHASKWAVEGMTEALAQEVADFGIKVTLVEPGAFKTDWSGNSAVRAAGQQQYDSVRARMAERSKKLPANFNGNPAGVGPAILQIVDADDPPLRVLFGLMPTVVVPGVYEQRLKLWKQWESVSLLANGN